MRGSDGSFVADKMTQPTNTTHPVPGTMHSSNARHPHTNVHGILGSGVYHSSSTHTAPKNHSLVKQKPLLVLTRLLVQPQHGNKGHDCFRVREPKVAKGGGRAHPPTPSIARPVTPRWAAA